MKIRGEGWLNIKDISVALTSFFYKNAYKGTGWGQIFGLFKRTYLNDRHLEQKFKK